MCLIAKSQLKLIIFSSSFKLNEIHTVDSPFNEDPKNIFSREALISGEGRSEILTTPANSVTNEARTIKLCTVIAYYITSIIKQLKVLNFHCSIVCSYCSVVYLIAKK